jgi:hypothetical protein
VSSWLTDLNLGQIIVAVGSVVTVVGLCAKAWKTIRPVWRGIREFLEDWRGEPARPEAGVPERPGVLKRLSTIETDGADTAKKLDETAKKLDAIDHELHPNSGKSLRDQVDNITRTLDEHIAQQQG